MKKTIIALAVVLIAGTVSSFAQGGGGFQMPTPEERVKRVHGKADSAFKLDEAKMKEMDAAYLDYYKAQDKVREEVMASAGGDRDAMRGPLLLIILLTICFMNVSILGFCSSLHNAFID